MSRFAFLLALGLASGAASAQYSGPVQGSVQNVDVASILKAPKDDQMVTLQGHIVSKVGAEKEKYKFSDGTGEIVVEIDDDLMKGQNIDDKTKVEIYGEVDTGLTRPPEIEVDRLRVVQ